MPWSQFNGPSNLLLAEDLIQEMEEAGVPLEVSSCVMKKVAAGSLNIEK